MKLSLNSSYVSPPFTTTQSGVKIEAVTFTLVGSSSGPPVVVETLMAPR